MRFRLRNMLVAGAAMVAASSVAWAAGLFQGFPIVGGAAYCTSFLVNPLTGVATTNCNGPAVPAGPTTLTGNELIPADTTLTQGQNPATVLIPTGVIFQHGQGAARNVLIGGDLGTNLWQRGTTFTSLTPTTSTLTADRWAVYSSGNTVTVTRQTGSTDIVTSAGQLASMRINRPSGTNTTAICVGQVIPQKEAERFLGNNAVFSFYELAGAGFLATSNQITANIAVFTSADSATPLTNTDAFMKGTLTNQTVINPTSATVTTAPVINTTTTWTRYSVSGAVPQLIAATQVTGIGVSICASWPASTGVAGDWFELAGLQLETTSTNVTTPGGFARRLQSDETAAQLAYSYVLTDAAITRVVGWCQEKVANTSANCYVQFPQEMRETPTTTVSATGWSIQQTDLTNELCSALAGITASNTVTNAGLLCTAPGTIAAGVVSPFLGGATTSTITFSAEP